MRLDYDPAAARAALAASDPVMRRLVGIAGPLRLESYIPGDIFAALLRAIVYQQLSGKAAATIHGRVLALFDGERASPQGLEAVPDDALRAAGLSANKSRAVRDLAAKCLDGTVPAMRHLRDFDDQAVIDRLTQVRGIGRWTVEMLLIFRLGRPDVLPLDDLGIRKGFAVAYERPLPKPAELREFGRCWAPYRSAASWYLWRVADDGIAAGATEG